MMSLLYFPAMATECSSLYFPIKNKKPNKPPYPLKQTKKLGTIFLEEPLRETWHPLI